MYLILTKDNCPYCTKAKALLESLSLPYRTIELHVDVTKQEAQELLGDIELATVPQVWCNDEHVGGFESLCDWLIETGEC